MNFIFDINNVGHTGFLQKKISNVVIVCYVLSILLCSAFFSAHILPPIILIYGLCTVVLFFVGSNQLGKKWEKCSSRKFVRNIFWTALAIRLLHVLVITVYNNFTYGAYYESNVGDIAFYVPTALQAASMHGLNVFASVSDWIAWDVQISDMGYMTYLSVLFTLMGAHGESVASISANLGASYVWLPLLLKTIYGALTCVLLYKIARRHFGEKIARIAAIFCMLQWNMVWWCGSMMKETEMVLIATWFVERMDRVILGQNVKPWFIAFTIVIGLLIYTFRSALFFVAIAASIFGLITQSGKKISLGKKIFAGIMIAVVMLFAVGGTIKEELHEMVETAQDSSYQQRNMEWRANSREHSNQFAKYAGTAVFAPLIFTIPFPNMVYTYQDQEMLMQVNGGNFEKNVLSFFVILAMIQLLFSGQWREHPFLIAYLVGYLLALALSVFAQSGRFHMPIIGFEMIFAAYGYKWLQNIRKLRWINIVLVLEVFICVGWSWFKLKGQGLL